MNSTFELRTINKILRLVRDLRSRADKGVEQHGQAWAEGVRFAANKIEALPIDVNQFHVPHKSINITPEIMDQIHELLGDKYPSDPVAAIKARAVIIEILSQLDLATAAAGVPAGWPSKRDGLPTPHGSYARGWNDAIDACSAALIQPAQPQGNDASHGWRPINQLPQNDGLYWFLRPFRNEVIVEGPRQARSSGCDAEDGWQWFAPCVCPDFQQFTSKSQATGVQVDSSETEND